MNIPDHISDSIETIFWFKILKFFDADADPGSGNLFDLGSGIRYGKSSDPGLKKIPESQPRHWFLGSEGGQESWEVLSAVYLNCFLLTGAEETVGEIPRFVSPFRCRDWGKYARRRRMISIKRFSGKDLHLVALVVILTFPQVPAFHLIFPDNVTRLPILFQILNFYVLNEIPVPVCITVFAAFLLVTVPFTTRSRTSTG
jgi:hypothetical protein